MRFMKHGFLLAVFLLPVGPSAAQAQYKYNLHQFAHETGDFVKQPGRWQGRDWLTLGVIAGGTALVMQADEPIRDAVLRNHGKYYRSAPIEAGRIWGEWYMPPLVAGAFGLHGVLADSPSSKKLAYEVVQSALYADAIAQILKITIGRARPYENRGAFYFRPFVLSSVGFHSLPGGHNTNGWAMSTVLAGNTRSTPLKILAYAPSTLTFLSRVYQDKHWTSDDFLGAAIGIVVGRWVTGLHEKKDTAVRVSAADVLSVSVRF